MDTSWEEAGQRELSAKVTHQGLATKGALPEEPAVEPYPVEVNDDAEVKGLLKDEVHEEGTKHKDLWQQRVRNKNVPTNKRYT